MDHLIENQIDIAVLTETWLSAGTRDRPVIGELEQPGFSLYHKPRLQRGGGVGALINSSFKVKEQSGPVFSSFESMRLAIQIKSVCIHLIIVYRVPPSSKNGLSVSDFVEQFTVFLDSIVTLKGKLIIAGDFNIHWDKDNEECKERKEFEMLLNTYNLKQLVTGPTHEKGHTLDLVITRNDDDCIISTDVNELLSDHRAIHCTLQCAKPPPCKKTIRYRKTKDLNPETLQQAVLATSLLVAPSDSLEKLVSQYQHDLTEVLDKLAPVKTKSFVERPLIPWMNDNILECKRRKRKCEKLWRQSNLTIHYEIYRAEKRNLENLIINAKTKHFSDKIKECSGHQGRIFKIVEHLNNVKGKPTLPEHDDLFTLCNTFNDFFLSKIVKIRNKLDEAGLASDSAVPNDDTATAKTQSFHTSVLVLDEQVPSDPLVATCEFVGQSLTEFTPISKTDLTEIIKSASNASCESDPVPTKLIKTILLDTLLPVICKIINLSLSSGNFPDLYKNALVTPLLKKISLDPECLKNFRPVSNLAFVSKLIEKVVANQFISHLKNNNLLETYQSAYKSFHSTETALLRVSNDVLRAIDDRQCVFLTLLDLSAAFDTIDHNVLLDLLHNDLGIHGTAHQWFQSYLSGRTQCVRIGEQKSAPLDLRYGVPQGSVLGPLLFCAYTTKLGQIIQTHDLNYHIYADDTQIYLSFSTDEAQTAIKKT